METHILWAIQYPIAGIVSLFISLYLLSQNPKSLPTRTFFMFGLFTALWLFLIFGHRISPTANLSGDFFRAAIFFAVLMPALLLLMVFLLRREKSSYYFCLVPAFIVAIIGGIIGPLEILWSTWGWTYKFPPFIMMLLLFSFLGYGITVVIISRVFARKSLTLRRKYNVISVSYLFYIIAMGITNLMLSMNPNLPPLGGILTFLVFLVISYAVILKPEKIEIPLGKPLEKLAEDWLKFLRKLREVTPGGELGEDLSKFEDTLRAIGFSDVVKYEDGKLIFNAEQLASLDINKLVDKTADFMRKQEWTLQTCKEYADTFTDLYKTMYEENKEAADSWLNTMLYKYGGFLDKQGVLAAMPSGTEYPTIFKELQSGKAYVFKEEKPAQAYKKLKETLEYGFEGLCFTKLEPQKVRAMYGVEKAFFVWLTFKEIKTEKTVSPKDLVELSSTVSRIVNKPSRIIVLLDCLDQIMFANSFAKAKSLLKEMKKLCKENDATLLLSMDPKMFGKEQLAAIEKELEEAE